MPKRQLEWKVEWAGGMTLAALTERLHEEGAGREDLKALLEARYREVCAVRCAPLCHPIRRASTVVPVR
jgi:hypothetical protein